MYTTNNPLPQLEVLAEEIAIKTDRDKYVEYLKIIEKYIQDNELIVTGVTSDKLLLKQFDLDCYKYEVYSAYPIKYGRELVTKLYEVDKDYMSKFATFSTRVAEYLFSISVNERDLVTMTALPTYKGVKMSDIVIPITKSSIFLKNPVNCIGAEIRLIRIYADLCNPSRVGDWSYLISVEDKLRDMVIKYVGKGEKKDTKKESYAKLWNYIGNSNRVIIGAYAIDYYSGKQHQHSRIQYITNKPLEEELAELVKLNRAYSGVINDPKIPTELKLKRLTIYYNNITTNGSGDKEAIIDIFNVGAYELIPYHTHNGFKYATPYVILRFRLIDMWTVKVLMHIKYITEQYHDEISKYIMEDFIRISRITDKLFEENQFEKLFSKNYVGLIEDPKLSIARKNLTKFYPPYMPLLVGN